MLFSAQTLHVNDQVCVVDFSQLEPIMQHRLKNVGITVGKNLKINQLYPFNGPCLVEFDGQQIGMRRQVLKALCGK